MQTTDASWRVRGETFNDGAIIGLKADGDVLDRRFAQRPADHSRRSEVDMREGCESCPRAMAGEDDVELWHQIVKSGLMLTR